MNELMYMKLKLLTDILPREKIGLINILKILGNFIYYFSILKYLKFYLCLIMCNERLKRINTDIN